MRLNCRLPISWSIVAATAAATTLRMPFTRLHSCVCNPLVLKMEICSQATRSADTPGRLRTLHAHTHKHIFFYRWFWMKKKSSTHHRILKTKCLIKKHAVSLNSKIDGKRKYSIERRNALKKNRECFTWNRNVSLKVKCWRSLNYQGKKNI